MHQKHINCLINYTIDILNGWTITGSVAFLVPTGTTQYKFSYEPAFSNYNIGYISDNPVP